MEPIREGKDFLVENLKMSEYVTFVASRLTVALVLAILGSIGLLILQLLRVLGVQSPELWAITIGLIVGIPLLWWIIRFIIQTHLDSLYQQIPEDSEPKLSVTPGSAASTLNASGSVISAGDSGEVCEMEGVYVDLINPESKIFRRVGQTFPPAVGKFGFLRRATWLLLEYPSTGPPQEDSDLEND